MGKRETATLLCRLRKSVAAYRARSIVASALAGDFRLSRIIFDGCSIRSG